METLMGVKGQDFVMLACDSTHISQIIKLKHGKSFTNITYIL